MPAYDYVCVCGHKEEIRHMMSDDTPRPCPLCQQPMAKQISSTFYVASGMKPTMADRKEEEHTKKVKDPERAVKKRKQAFGVEAVGNPSMKADPKHVIKRGRTLGGQQKDVDRKEFIKAAAKDPATVAMCQKIIQKKS